MRRSYMNHQHSTIPVNHLHHFKDSWYGHFVARLYRQNPKSLRQTTRRSNFSLHFAEVHNLSRNIWQGRIIIPKELHWLNIIFHYRCIQLQRKVGKKIYKQVYLHCNCVSLRVLHSCKMFPATRQGCGLPKGMRWEIRSPC